ncbi:dickkopf-related protein 3-like isoform X2 [Hyla sarda]|uniref:dickkopf-related protein 3-like isoform X2 n=1 Tax=Hyla sarda TaxID=327740 RepID=UPI0024C42B27|nr:dickkopf-related protein 3-like isoform X2 [Hyla sarda]
MPLLLPAFFLIVLGSTLTTSFPSPGNHSQYEGDRNATEQMGKECNDSRNCLENQYCHLSPDIAECLDCKSAEMTCQQDEECCPGWVCALSKCTERLIAESGGARCEMTEDQCAPGFCCSRTGRLPFPVCLPLPSEGEQCSTQSSNLLKLINFRADYDLGLQYCHCAEGLVCTSKGSLISTCEKPDDVIDFTNYSEDSIFQPMIRREEELTYYDADLVPWASQDDQLAFVDFPKKAELNERAKRSDFQMFNADIDDRLQEDNLHFDAHVEEPGDPSETDFQELKQLASEMGQYFGPGFY